MRTRNHLPNLTRALALATFLLVLAALVPGQTGAPASSFVADWRLRRALG